MAIPQLVVNGKLLQGDMVCRVVEGIAYASIREIFAGLGGIVVWQPRENQAVITWRHYMLIVPTSGLSLTLNGDKKTITHPLLLVDGRLYVALESLAEVFAGNVKITSEEANLFLPVGQVTGWTLNAESLVLQWTGNGGTNIISKGANLGIELLGTSMPIGLKRMSLERAPEGHLLLYVDVRGGAVEHTLGEQGLRVTWKGSIKALAGVTIALDAGHGGQYPGALGASGKPEKDLTRVVTDKVSQHLVALGANVVDIRPEDQSVTLAERVSRSRQAKAKAFVSIHFNAHEKLDANGTETFHAANNAPAAALAQRVQAEVVGALKLRNRGVKQAAFHVLQAQPEIPAILVELGFISNPSEEAFILKESTLSQAAEAIARGVAGFFN